SIELKGEEEKNAMTPGGGSNECEGDIINANASDDEDWTDREEKESKKDNNDADMQLDSNDLVLILQN
ncbi:hypothetical protein FQN50_002817, partial [Emmonsiellopsis sp. PD_5]